MADVTLTPVGGDPFNGGAVDLDPATAPPVTMSAGPTAIEQGALTGDPTAYATQPLPGTAQTLQQLGSGHLAQDWADYSGNHGLSLVGTAAGTVDGATNGARFVGDMLGGRYGTDVTNPAATAQVAPRAFELASMMGVGGLPMAEENALGVAGGKGLAKAKAAPADDPLAALMAALDAQAPAEAPRTMAETGIVDPSAASWRLHHGTDDPSWSTFDPSKTGARTHGAEVGAMYMSPREGEASTYANGDGARVLSLDVTPGNTGVYDVARMTATRDPRFMDYLQQESGGAGTHAAVFRDALDRYDRDVAYHNDLLGRMPADVRATMPDYPAMSNLMSPQAAAVRMAREDGRDTAILRGLGESSGGDQVVALRPGFVHDAATGRLVYSGGIPGSAAVLQAQQPQPAQQSASPEAQALARALMGGTAQ